MIEYTTYKLSNGLNLMIHEDHSTPMAVLNLMYHVGSKHEDPEHTGLAHFLEHMMFEGTSNVINFDETLQQAGAEHNAFTNTDVTNYYISLPAINLETAIYLEADRMSNLLITEEAFNTQKNVVLEEFKQRYLNQPYGDFWHQLRPMAYRHHPYQWPTIGKDQEQIKQLKIEQMQSFYSKYYSPGNATLVIAGGVKEAEVIDLVNKWFGDIRLNNNILGALPEEPAQTDCRLKKVQAQVPSRMMYRAYHMPARKNPTFYHYDLLGDIIGRGKSSLLHKKLVKELRLFNSIGSGITGNFDPGLFVITGRVNDGVDQEEAIRHLDELLSELITTGISNNELQKVKNQALTNLAFNDLELINRALSLATGHVLGNSNLINEERSLIMNIEAHQVLEAAKTLFNSNAYSQLIYEPVS